MALEDAGLHCPFPVDPLRVGVSIGTTMGEAQVLENIDKTWIEQGEESITHFLIPQYPSSNLSANVAFEFGFAGPNVVIPTACAAGNYAIGYAYNMLQAGHADVMIAGGSDPLSKIAFTGFNRLFAMAPEKCQPFDKNRKGMMLGEGAGIIILELLEDALERNATCYAEILGYGLSCDAHHMTIPHADGIERVIRNALDNAHIQPEDVDYICAHGTGTGSNDKIESFVIKKIFGNRTQKIPINSIKSMLGHTMGAASALEAISCVLTIKNDIIPPTINYETPDPECDVDCVPNIARRHKVNIALNNSFAFGGNNACLVLGKHV
jgi:3-oxoacyl-[acyl-carrier-protein] synthase II